MGYYDNDYEEHNHAIWMGDIVITQRARATLDIADVWRALSWHQAGNWGDLGPKEWDENEEARGRGGRVVSVYRDSKHQRFWVKTSPDRTTTTVQMPGEAR